MLPDELCTSVPRLCKTLHASLVGGILCEVEALKSKSRNPEIRHLGLSERAHTYLAESKKASPRKQNRYWPYHTLLFENQGEENSGYVTDEFLRDLAEQTPGLDVREWEDQRGKPLCR